MKRNNEHRAFGSFQDSISHATRKQMIERSATMRSEHNQIDTRGFRLPENEFNRWPVQRNRRRFQPHGRNHLLEAFQAFSELFSSRFFLSRLHWNGVRSGTHGDQLRSDLSSVHQDNPTLERLRQMDRSLHHLERDIR